MKKVAAIKLVLMFHLIVLIRALPVSAETRILTNAFGISKFSSFDIGHSEWLLAGR